MLFKITANNDFNIVCGCYCNIVYVYKTINFCNQKFYVF